MRIGIISHNYPKNVKERKDAGIFAYDFANELAIRNKVFILAPGEGSGENSVGKTRVFWHKWLGGKKMGKFQFYNPFDYVKYSASFLIAFWRSVDFVEKGKLDYVLAMWVFPAGLFALFIKLFFGKKYSLWALGSDIYVYAKYPIVGFVIYLIVRNAEFVFADGFDLCKRIKEVFDRDVIFLPSSSNFEHNEKSKRHDKKIVVAFLGRLEKVKGIDVLIDAIVRVGSNPKFIFNIIGDGSLREELEEKVLSSGLKNVKFWGNPSDSSKIAAILVNSDWLVIPSRGDSIPLVFSEGAKCNLPMIVSDLPDLKKLIKKYDIGYVSKVGSSKNLAKIIMSLSGKMKDRKRFLKNIKSVKKDFNIGNSAKMFLQEISK